MLCTIGSRIGLKIRIAGVVSITIPTIRRNILIMISNTISLLKCAKIHALTVCGTCINVSTLENAVDAARINKIGAYVFMASTIMAHISFTFMDL